MKETYYEKGQVSGNVSNIIILITGVGIAVIVLIFVGSLGGQTYEIMESDIDQIGRYTAVHDVFQAINGTAVSLDHPFIESGTLVIYNQSNVSVVGLDNFTIDYSTGALTLKTVGYNATNMSANYTWHNETIRSSIKDGILSSFDALENTGEYLPLIVIAVVITMVLLLIFSVMGGGASRPSGSAL
jgi:hypothetical protein